MLPNSSMLFLVSLLGLIFYSNTKANLKLNIFSRGELLDIRAVSIDHDTLHFQLLVSLLSSLLLISKRLVLVGVVKQGISMCGSTRVRTYDASKRMTSQKYNARRNAQRLRLLTCVVFKPTLDTYSLCKKYKRQLQFIRLFGHIWTLLLIKRPKQKQKKREKLISCLPGGVLISSEIL